MTEDSSFKMAKTVLATKYNWPKWFDSLRVAAESRLIWDHINPDAPNSDYFLQPPTMPLRPERPPTGDLQAKAAYELEKDDFMVASREYSMQKSGWEAAHTHYVAMSQWVSNTVKKEYTMAAHNRLLDPKVAANPPNASENSSDTPLPTTKVANNLQRLLRELKGQFEPGTSSVISHLQDLLQKSYETAKRGNVAPEVWNAEWTAIHAKAVSHKLPEVQGNQAKKAYLKAIRERYAPQWAQGQLDDLITAEITGKEPLTLQQLNSIFMEQASHAKGVHGTKQRSFAALGNGGADHGSAGATQESSANNSSSKACPCDKDHAWPPTDCRRVEYALKGSARPLQDGSAYGPISERNAKAIRRKIQDPKWATLRKNLDKLGWTSNASQGLSHTVSAVGINPDLLKPDPAVNLAVTVMMGPHTLSTSTVYDTGGSSHLVNDLSLLQEGTFVPAPPGRVVEAGTSSFSIKGTGTRVIKGLLNGKNGRKVDLELRNVDLVEGFHTNIVSAALLRVAGIWHCGEDHTLNIGPKGKSVVVRQLKVVANLSFLEYTPLYQYPQVLPAPTETVRSFVSQRRAPTGEEQVRRPIVRKDSEALWHARTGHLGVTALRKIPERGQNVALVGEPMETCEICRLAHAKRAVSRRPTERAPRPFYKVLWDLFDYPKGYDGSQWLLVLKDDYSGKLWSFPIASKAHTQLFSIIRSFERHVHRRYNLHLNVLKHDGEKGVIAIQGMTEYQRWAQEEGIELQLSPPYTHEPNGGPERAGQEVIVRALKMLKHANLPEALWPEAVMTATKLINMSPAKSQRFRSPDEVLFDWFEEHSKHFGTLAVRAMQTDLRPNWSGIYVFGCKAFALQTSRAAGVDRRAYKVQLRGQIGYLVGYVATNIYKIWLPKHGKVIQTRDVTFDETQFYKSGETPRLEPDVIEYLEVRPADIPLSDSGFTRDTVTLWDQLEQMDDETVPTLRPKEPLVAT